MYSAVVELLGITTLFLQMLSLKSKLLPLATCFWRAAGAITPRPGKNAGGCFPYALILYYGGWPRHLGAS